jgi:CheY-like chemotaxis protein
MGGGQSVARILVIDGRSGLQALVRAELGRVGHEVLCAPTGREGLQVAVEQRPDVILLDLDHPGGAGGEVCRRIETGVGTSDIPIVHLTTVLGPDGASRVPAVSFETAIAAAIATRRRCGPQGRGG